MGTAEVTDVYLSAGFGFSVPRGPRPAVIVVDFSYGFTDPLLPTGAEMSAEVGKTRVLLDVARGASVPVFFSTIAYTDGERDTLAWLRKAAGMKQLMAGSRLVAIDDRLGRMAHEPLIVKHGASAFHGTNLVGLLNAICADTVIVTGATTSGCVRATVVDAVQYGFNVLVPRDCVADRAAAPHEANLFDIHQKYADVISSDDALAYLASVRQDRLNRD